MGVDDVVARSRRRQADWYGEPVGETVRRLTAALDLTQGELASVVGLSAPMLSQLASGQRAKITNPSVLARLQGLAALADEPGLVGLSRAQLDARVQAVRELDGSALTTGALPARAAEHVQALLRAVASPDDLERAAALLDADHPRLAELVRVHGLGGAEQAREHYARSVGGPPTLRT